jgi:hypothetical protein
MEANTRFYHHPKTGKSVESRAEEKPSLPPQIVSRDRSNAISDSRHEDPARAGTTPIDTA